MAEENDRGATDAPARRTGLLPLYSLAATFAAIAGFLSVILFDRLGAWDTAQQPAIAVAETASQKSLESGLAKLVRAESPKPLADFAFADGDGAERKLSDFRGKVVLVNLWATWCAPCKIEMPGLDRLQAQLGGDDFTVLPISLDLGGPDKPKRYLEANNLANLGFYQSASTKLIQQFGAPGLPFTMLVDREGREIARLAGPAEWDSPEAIAIIREAMASQS
jgi:thiol-disulfide isomerase/thioredoxin